MTMTQRDWDISQLESQLKIQRLFDEWKVGFLGNRAAPPQPNEQFTPPEVGGAEEVSIENEVVDSLGGGY